MKRTRWLFAALVLAALVPAAPASAASDSRATCIGSWDVYFSRGVAAVPGSSEFGTRGPTGTVECLGNVEGEAVTGTGTFAKEGRFEGTCLSGTGAGNIQVTLPTTGGPKHVEIPFTMTTGPGIGFKYSDYFAGPLTFVFVPVEGDCLLSPVTRIAVFGTFTLQT